MRIPQEISVLIDKYQAGTATAQELEQLNQWYHSFDDSEVEITLADRNVAQLSDRIKQRLLQTIEEEKTPTHRRRWQLSAAAILFLLFSVGAYFFFLQKPAAKPVITKTVIPSPINNDIAPGGNKAILTLADNSTIILDSATNGILSTQGNIKIEKLDNGLLAYSINGKKITEKDEAFYNTISTPRGGQYQITLSDGTKVWLNASSSIRFPVVFTGTERKVTVTGETYFEVAHNAAMPFRVQAATSEVEVLGTHFNINAYDDEAAIKTTLLEGKVKVSVPSLANGTGSFKFLSPGQQSGINKKGDISILNNADLEEAVAWKDGHFQYKSADLRSILRQIARWYDVEIEYRGKVDLHFTGQLTRSDNVSKVFEKLKMAGDVQFKIDGKKVIVSK